MQREFEGKKELKQKQGSHRFTLKSAQRQAFLEVFNLHAVDGRVGPLELKAMFSRHFADICSKAFDIHPRITFEEFMDVFRIRDSPHNLRDIKNAFRLLAGEQDEFLPLDLIYQIFRKAGVEKQRVDDLMTVLVEYVDVPKRVFNYKQFLEQLA